jgi:hypothetical protein
MMCSLTEAEKSYIRRGRCCYCNSDSWYEGPHGGFCTNIECARCGARFNVGPEGYSELIGAPTKDVPRLEDPPPKRPWWKFWKPTTA